MLIYSSPPLNFLLPCYHKHIYPPHVQAYYLLFSPCSTGDQVQWSHPANFFAAGKNIQVYLISSLQVQLSSQPV